MIKKITPSPSLIEILLESILGQLNSKSWTLRELFQALKGHGTAFLIIFLSLPFCQPLQIPGFSTPFGIALIFIGLRMIGGKHIRWPQWILKRQIGVQLLRNIINKSLWFIRTLKPLLYKRWSWLCQDPLLYRFHGIFVILMGGYLALPLPLPFSNILVAWALLFMGLGLLEEDGLFICLAYGLGIISILALGYFIFWLHHWIF